MDVSRAAGTEKKRPALLGGLPPDQYKVMVALCGGALTPEDVCLELGWDRGREGHARKALEASGMLKLAGRVGHWKIYEPTPKGLAWARDQRMPVAPRLTKGGAVHAFCLRRFEEALGGAVPGVRFVRAGLAGATGGVQPDTMALLADGWAMAVQVCHRNRPDYEARCLLDLCRVDRIDRVISVASSRTCQRNMEKQVKKMCGHGGGSGGGRGGVPEKLKMCCISECLSETFDCWWGLLGRRG